MAAKRRRRLTRRQRWRRTLLIWVPVIVVAGICWPLAYLIPSGPAGAADPVRITDYVSDYQVDGNGGLTASETLTTLFPAGRHGIFRYWDAVNPGDSSLRHDVQVTSVTVDGKPEPIEVYREGGDRYTIAKIGNPDGTLTPGVHEYRITYSMTGAITSISRGAVPAFVTNLGESSPTAQSAFWWNVVAQGWRMPIDRARITVSLPSPALNLSCSAATVGPDSSQPLEHGEGPCQLSGAGSTVIKASAQRIPPYGGMTIRATMALPPPPVAATGWPWQLDPILGRSPSQLATMLLAAVAAGLLGAGWWLATRERTPGLPVLYEPPAGLGPVQTVFAALETTGEHDIAATVFHVGESGLLRVTTQSRSWSIIATEAMASAELAALDPVSRAIVEALGCTEPDAEFRATGSRSSGEKLTSARKAGLRSCRAWSSSQRFTRPSLIGWAGRVMWCATVVAAVAAFTHRWTPTSWALVPLAFAAAGSGLMRAGATRRRTRAGRQLWSRAGGFRRMLATPSSELRFDFAARQEFFLPYLPYAVAFGVAKEWAQKYTSEMETDPPKPEWLSNASHRITPATLTSTVSSFESTVRSTISAYQSGGSGSGGSSSGGGSVGSGGGGGGGGSW